MVGEHAAYFAGARRNVLVLSHKADDRAIFANGALKAALLAREPEARPPIPCVDVLGLSRDSVSKTCRRETCRIRRERWCWLRHGQTRMEPQRPCSTRAAKHPGACTDKRAPLERSPRMQRARTAERQRRLPPSTSPHTSVLSRASRPTHEPYRRRARPGEAWKPPPPPHPRPGAQRARPMASSPASTRTMPAPNGGEEQVHVWHRSYDVQPPGGRRA